MEKIYVERLKEWVSLKVHWKIKKNSSNQSFTNAKGHLGYGRKNPNGRLTEEDSAIINFGVFDLNDH